MAWAWRREGVVAVAAALVIASFGAGQRIDAGVKEPAWHVFS
jgi:hypothetical protein